MTFAAPDPIPSGQPLMVRVVGGRSPHVIDDFVGADVKFSVDYRGQQCQVAGDGCQLDEAVRFHEKDARSGKDVRVWRITRVTDGQDFQAVLV